MLFCSKYLITPSVFFFLSFTHFVCFIVVCVWGGGGGVLGVCVAKIMVICISCTSLTSLHLTSKYNGHPTRLAVKVISGVHPLFTFLVIFVHLTSKTR